MRVVKNFFYNVAYQILIMILPLITAPYIARVLGVENIGIYSYTYSIAYYFLLFGQLGFNLYGNRTIATDRDNKQKLSKSFSSIYTLQFIISIITIISYTLFVIFGTTRYKVYFFLQSFLVISSLFDISWFFFGIEKFKFTVGRSTLIKIVTVILVLLCVKTKDDLYIYILIMSLGQLLGQLLLWTQVNKYINFKFCKFKECLVHLKPILILFLPTIATSLYRVMDKIMLGSNAEIEQLGYYENSEKFIAISMGIINALGTVMIPQISNLVSKGEDNKIIDYINKSMEGIFILAAPITFGLALISHKLAVVFYGDEFSACGEIIFVLSFSILFSTWANVIRTQYLIPNKKDKEYIISMFGGAIFNILINILLIPKYGAIGAAIGTIIAEATVAIMHSIYSHKYLKLFGYLKMVIPYIAIGYIMYIVIKIINISIINSIVELIMMIFAGGIVYILFVCVYLVLSKNQYYYIIKNFLSKKFGE